MDISHGTSQNLVPLPRVPPSLYFCIIFPNRMDKMMTYLNFPLFFNCLHCLQSGGKVLYYHGNSTTILVPPVGLKVGPNSRPLERPEQR